MSRPRGPLPVAQGAAAANEPAQRSAPRQTCVLLIPQLISPTPNTSSPPPPSRLSRPRHSPPRLIASGRVARGRGAGREAAGPRPAAVNGRSAAAPPAPPQRAARGEPTRAGREGGRSRPGGGRGRPVPSPLRAAAAAAARPLVSERTGSGAAAPRRGPPGEYGRPAPLRPSRSLSLARSAPHPPSSVPHLPAGPAAASLPPGEGAEQRPGSRPAG